MRPLPVAGAPRQLSGIVFVVPAQALRTAAEDPALPHDVPALSAAKGIEIGTSQRMSEVLIDSGWAPDLVGALSGPNLAHEIARGLPAAAVVASADEAVAEMWQRALSGERFRVYRSTDVIGVELAGALKNIIAIAAGAAAGLGFGANTVSALMTRGLAEITRLGVAAGADAGTFLGLAGVGDLAATCFSPLSRNQRLGQRLAAGESAEAAMRAIGEVVEGAATAPVALELAAPLGVELPIAEQVAAVVAGRRSVAEAMTGLLTRGLRAEG